ncbi:unnamed protein product [Lota lota]
MGALVIFPAGNSIAILKFEDDTCVGSPPLRPVHICEATHSSIAILKFEDDTTILGLISNNDETAYREEEALESSITSKELALLSMLKVAHIEESDESKQSRHGTDVPSRADEGSLRCHLLLRR